MGNENYGDSEYKKAMEKEAMKGKEILVKLSASGLSVEEKETLELEFEKAYDRFQTNFRHYLISEAVEKCDAATAKKVTEKLGYIR